MYGRVKPFFLMINITFPDGNVRQYADGTTALDVAKSISEGLARVVLAATVNGASSRVRVKTTWILLAVLIIGSI